MSTINSTINFGVTIGAGPYPSPLTITNTGYVNDTSASSAAVNAPGAATLVNDGRIAATATLAEGVSFGSTASLDNVGTITGAYYGVNFTGAAETSNLTNSGTINADGGFGRGVISRGATTITNLGGGLITGNSNGVLLLAVGTITNSGTIGGADAVSAYAGTVFNTGTIAASYGDGVSLGKVGDPVLSANELITNGASGLISAVRYDAVYLYGTLNQVLNAGTITGYTGVVFNAPASATSASSGNTLIDSGTIIGTAGTAISFVTGNDTLQLQAGHDFIQGVVNGGTGTSTLEFLSSATPGTLTGSNADFVNFAIGTVDTGAYWVLAGTVTFSTGITLANNSGFSLAASGTLVNASSITSSLTGDSIEGGGTAALLDNLGSIQAYNIGVSLQSGGTIINGASGNTTALIGAHYGVYVASGLVSNYGTISASGSGSESVLLGGVGQVSNHAGGLITGHNVGVDLGNGLATATLTNYGVVSATNNGALALSDGDVVMNGTGALITGTRAVLMAAAVTTSVSETLKNYGTITGQYGVIDGVIPSTGTLQATILDAGTIIGTGGTAIAAYATGASVDLTLRFLVGNDFIQGAVVGETNGTGVLDFTSGAGAGTLTGSGADFTNFQTASVDAGANWVFAGTNTLGASVSLVDAGTLTNIGSLVVDPPITVTGTFINSSVVSAPGTYTAFYIANGGVVSNTSAGIITAGNAAITAIGTVAITNLGTIQGTTGDAIDLAAGSVGNGVAGTYSEVIAGSNFGVSASGVATVTNHGTILGTSQAGIDLAAGGSVNNGGGIRGATAIIMAGAGTVSNGGGIYGTVGVAISLAAGGSVGDNGGITGATGGVQISGAAGTVNVAGGLDATGGFGVSMAAGGSVSVGGGISAHTDGVDITGGLGVVGVGGGLTGATGIGAYLGAGGNVVVNGGISGGTDGVRIAGGTGTVSLYGHIKGAAGIGVDLLGGGTIIDRGAIYGATTAVALGGTASNLLILEKGYSLHGGVVGSASASNTVELLGTSASAAAVATYNSLGLIDIGTIAFAPSVTNYATLLITNDTTLPNIVANFTATHDAIDLTTLGYVSGSSTASFNTSSDQLTVSNGTNAVTLQLGGGSYTNVTWNVQNDGSGGSEILPQSHPTNFLIPNETTLNAVFAEIAAGGIYSQPSIDFMLTITNSFSLTSAVSSLTLATGDSLTFDGGGFTINGGGTADNFLNLAAPVTINDLALVNAQLTAVAGASWNFTGTDTIGTGATLTNSGTLTDSGTLVDVGTINGAITLGGSPALLSVAAGGLITDTGTGALISGTGTDINDGTITGSDSTIVAIAGAVLNSGSIGATAGLGVAVDANTVTNLGTITNTGSSSFAVEATSTVVNGSAGATSALIDGVHTGVGLVAGGGGGTVINYGTVIGGNFVGVDFDDVSGGTIGIDNSGTILSGGSYAVVALEDTGGFATLNNTGIIQGTTGNSYGVVFRANGSLTNSGLISSPVRALAIGNGFAAVVTNTGTLSGNIAFASFGTTNQTLIDSGTIAGTGGTAVAFASGNDLLQFQPSASAVVQGIVNGGSGTNTLEFASGATTGTFTGTSADFINFQYMSIASGAAWQLAGSETFGSGVALFDHGSLTISGTVVANVYGQGEAPITIDASGDLSNGGTGNAIYAVYNNSGTVVNFGTIAASGASSTGVRFKGGGSVDNLGTITGHYAVEAYGYLTVTNAGTIGSGSATGINVRGGGSVYNSGVVLGSTAIKGPAFSLVTTVDNTGTIEGQDGVNFAATDTAAQTVIDSGTIIALSGDAVQFGAGDALMLFQPSATVFIGRGIIGGTASNTLEFASGATAGTLTGSNAYFSNFGIGTVDTGAVWTLAGQVSFASSVVLDNGGSLTVAGTVVNAGSIINGIVVSGTSALLSVASSGYVSNGGKAYAIGLVGGSVTNAGTINSFVNGISGSGGGVVLNTGLLMAITGDGIYLNGGGYVHNTSLISAAEIGLYVEGAAGTFVNSGTLSGSGSAAVLLAAGGTVSNTALGLITNTAGNDGVFVSGTAARVVNAGTIDAGVAGIDLTGTTNTLIDSGTIIGGIGLNTYAVDLAGTTNLLQFQPGNAFIQGEVDGGTGTSTLEFASAATAGTLTGSSAYFTNFKTASVDTGANWVFAGTNTLGANVSLVDAGTLTNTGTLIVDPPITVTGTFINTSLVSATGTYTAIYVANGGVVTNTTGGTITAGDDAITAAGTVAIINYGEITSTTTHVAVSLASGSVTNALGGTITGYGTAVLGLDLITVVNAGSIASAPGNGSGLGILLFGGGSVTNLSGGVITSGGAGILAYTVPATVTNAGTIAGDLVRFGPGVELAGGGTVSNQSGGLITGYYGVEGQTQAIAVSNYGSIVGLGTAGRGVDLFAGGTISNLSGGVITGRYGVLGSSVADVVVNTGSIGGGATGTGVALTAGGTVIDAGVISGSTAVSLGGAGSNLLVLEQGYTLVGHVVGSTSASNTLELLGTSTANAVTATYNTLGLTSIGTIAFAPTASNYADLKITNDTTLPGTITNFTGAHDTIDLTTLGFVSGSSIATFNTSSDQLTVSNGTNAVTLQLGAGSYSGVSWQAISDGASGTDIVPNAATAPVISGAVANQAVANQGTVTPFSAVSITDPTGDGTITATVTLSAGNGTLSNLDGGTFISDVYSFTGSSSAATTALDGLVFTPVSPASGVYVTTTGFTIAAQGTGGTNTDTATTVTAVQQVLGLAAVLTSNIIFSVSPNGTSFAAATGGKTNEAIVTAPTGGEYDLPSGYQAEFLGGSTAAELVDTGVDNAVLVGNSGNDTIGAGGAVNDSIVGGNGANDIFGGTGTVAVVAGSGNNRVQLSNGSTYSVSLGGGNDTVYASGAGTINGGTGDNIFTTETVAGTNQINSDGSDVIYANGTLTNVSIGGSGSELVGGVAGTVDATITGGAASVAGFGGSINVTTSGGTGLYFGGSSDLDITDQGNADTIVATSGAVTVNATTNPLVFGGSGPLLVTGGAGTPTVVGGAGGASVVAGTGGVVVATGGSGVPTVSGAATLFGGNGGMIDYVGSVGGVVFSDAADTGSTTIDAAGSSTGNLFYGSPSLGSSLLVIGGSATDTVIAGPGATTVEATGADAVAAGSGSLRFVAGAGSSTVFGGTGTASISGGSDGVAYVGGSGVATLDGAVTADGGAGGVIDYVGSVGGLTYYAASGAETLNAGLSSTGNLMWAGASSVSSNVMIGGSGNDSLIAGAGADTLTGGGGSDLFVFLDGRAGGTAVVTDFSAQDVVELAGYGSGAAATALDGAVSSVGNTTITLTDSTQITFMGVSSVFALQGHVFSS